MTTQDTPKSLREREGLSQRQLAARARATVRTLSRFEQGESKSIQRIERVAGVLGVSAAHYVAAMVRRRAQRKAAPLLARRRVWSNGKRRVRS
jgi:transcriptional regulator with XRE-family HTH domain